MIPVAKKNTRLKLALAISVRAPIILTKEIIDIAPLFADKTIKFLSKIIKSSNVFTKFFSHYFSFLNFCIKIVFDFIDFI